MVAHAARSTSRFLCFIVLLIPDVASSRNGGSPVSSRGSPTGHRGSTHADRFVQAAPLIIGVTCGDGVLLLAAHTYDDDEPLLYFNPSGSEQVAAMDSDGTSDAPTPNTASSSSPPPTPRFRNLPPYYAGPFRIQVIEPTSRLVLASTGWRADCDDLVRSARGLAAHEVSRYGPPSGGAGGGGEADRRGTILSHDLSLYLALCAVSENARAKSCVGLLATPSSLWLIDSTGATPVRALCVGGGAAAPAAPRGDAPHVDKDLSLPSAVSDAVNERLMQVADWTRLDCHQALGELLRILGDERGSDSPPPTGMTQPLLRHGTRLEVAFVGRSKVTRYRLPEGSLRFAV